MAAPNQRERLISRDDFRYFASGLQNANSGSLLAVMDACKVYDLIQRLMKSNIVSYPLQTDGSGLEMQKELPWLVELSTDEALDSLSEHYGEGSFIFLHSRSDYWDVFEHLAFMTTAVLPDGRATWLRYYEPCFLRALVSQPDAMNGIRLYGDRVLAYFAENPREQSFERFEPLPEFARKVPPNTRLVLTPSLLERLDDARMGELKRLLAAHYLGSSESSGQLELDELESRLGELVERSSDYSIDDLKSLRIMTDAARFWGWDFDLRHPKAVAALHDQGSPGWMRAAYIKNLLHAEQGEAL